MALRVEQFQATIPPGATKANPHVVTLELDNWEVTAIDLEVPPGPGGAMGFYVANNGIQWLPRPAGEWLVWDNYRDRWPLEGQPNGEGWQIVGYNNGTYPHTVSVRFHVILPPEPRPATAPQIQFVTTEPPTQEPVIV